MTDTEYLIIDELYFVTHFDDLLEATEMEEATLRVELKNIITKKWVRVFSEKDAVDERYLDKFDAGYQSFYYLASKEGLLAHNTR